MQRGSAAIAVVFFYAVVVVVVGGGGVDAVFGDAAVAFLLVLRNCDRVLGAAGCPCGCCSVPVLASCSAEKTSWVWMLSFLWCPSLCRCLSTLSRCSLGY